GVVNNGILETAKRNVQKCIDDLARWLNFQEAATTDNHEKTVSSADQADIAADIVEGPARDLIETVATEIADKIMASVPILYAVEVTVHKPDAPIERTFHDVSVVARRSRKTERR